MNASIENPDEIIPDYFDKAYPGGLKGWIGRVLFRLAGWFLRRAVRFRKSFWIPHSNKLVVMGFDLVQEVFTRWQDCPTPNESKAEALGWDSPFLLALKYKDSYYDKMHKHTREIFADEALVESLQGIAAEAFEELLPTADCGPSAWKKVDLGWGYTYPGFMKIVEEYFGVDIKCEDRVKFVCAQLVVSGFFFGGPKVTSNSKKTDNAIEAFSDLWNLIEEQVNHWTTNKDTAKGAMRIAVNHPDNIDTDTLTSYFLGTILGFIPTNGQAHERILEYLFCNPTAKAWAAHYVSDQPNSSRDGEFLAVLHECLRMNYILPGLFRQAERNNIIIGRESERPQYIPKGSTIIVSSLASMFDPHHFDKPFKFRPDRSYWSYLNYGHNMHFCVAWDISNIIMTEYFRALIIRNIEPDPHIETVLRSMFPWHRGARYRRGS